MPTRKHINKCLIMNKQKMKQKNINEELIMKKRTQKQLKMERNVSLKLSTKFIKSFITFILKQMQINIIKEYTTINQIEKKCMQFISPTKNHYKFENEK